PTHNSSSHHRFLSDIFYSFFFFNDTATPEIYTLSLHDALPIFPLSSLSAQAQAAARRTSGSSSASLSRRVSAVMRDSRSARASRSEEHTSELQSRGHLVCRLLLEKKKKKKIQEVIHLQLREKGR